MGVGPESIELLQAPTRVSDLGIADGLAEDLFLRRVLTERLTTIGKASDALSISHAVGDELAEGLRQKNLIEYQGVEGRDYRVTLTELGQRLTSERMKTGRHVSHMPVSINAYQYLVEMQRASVQINRSSVKDAYRDLVLEDSLLDQIGPAFLSEGAIFFYGPPGTGKTSLAERMSRFYADQVLIPRFLEADGQIITVFDPSLHRADPNQPPDLDPRYILCERPLIMVGGELTLDMMDLQYDEVSGLSAAPIQLLANNGILVVDDFGRQTPTPDEILNRWIVPLSRGIDFLRPKTGTKFTVPFELKLVISTNLDPHSLGDDAFLRRLRNKVYVGACSEAAFDWVLVRAADRVKLEVTQEAASYLANMTKDFLGELRPYVAIDFCDLAVGICQYDDLPMKLTSKLIDRVANVYFVRKTDAPSDGGLVGSGPSDIADALRPAMQQVERRGPVVPAPQPIGNPGR